MITNFGKKENRLTVLYCLLIGGLIIITLILASVPPVSRDALTHHLAVPKLWIKNGGICEIPSVPFSYYPMNLDLLYAVPLYFENDIFPKYIHYSFALFTAVLIYFYLRKRLDTNYALLGVLLFLSIPIIVKLSVTVYVDLGLIFFSTASILSLIKWMNSGYRLKFLLLSAICCGLALGTKYNGLIVFFLLTCFVPFIYLRGSVNEAFTKDLHSQVRAFGFSLVFLIVAILFFSPWMIKNVIQTSNPVYPLYNSWFNSSNSGNAVNGNKTDVEQANRITKRDTWGHFAVRKVIYGESFGQILMIPLRIFFEGQDDDPKHFDGKLNPFLLIFPLLLFLHSSKKENLRISEIKILSIFSTSYLVFVFLQVDMRIRWISPIIPPMVILSILGLERLQSTCLNSNGKSKALCLKCMTGAAVIAMLLFNVHYIHDLYQKIDPNGLISGKIDRDTYIKKFRPEYELISYINRQLPEDSVALCLFIGKRIYYFDRQIRVDLNMLERAVISSESIDQIWNKFSSVGITHILLRYDLFDSWFNNNLNSDKQGLLKIFFQKRVKKLKSDGGYGLFELVHATSNQLLEATPE